MADTDLDQQQNDFIPALEKHRAQEEVKVGALRALVLERLRSGLWHTTNSDCFQGISRSCAILPEPDLENSKRWCTARGSAFYPYGRTIGDISLLDF